MGEKTIEEVLAEGDEPGATIEEVLGLSVDIPHGISMVSPRLDKPLIGGTQLGPSPTEVLGPVGGTRSQQRQMLLEGSLMGLGGLGGGLAGRAFLGPALTRPIGAALGETLGTMTGGRVARMPPDEAAMAGLMAGGLGLAVEGGANMLGRASASTLGSVTSDEVKQTMKLPWREQADVMLKNPAARGSLLLNQPEPQAQMRLGRDVLDRISKARAELSPGRLTKKNIIMAADASNVQVPRASLDNAIKSGIADADLAEGRANSIAGARLRSLGQALEKKFPSGSLTAKQADAQLQAFQRDAEMANARNNPFLAQTYRSLKDTLRKAFFGAVDEALPNSNIARATADAKRYMDSIDKLEQFISDKTPETFIRSIGSNEEDAQSAMDALRVFEMQTGTNGALEKEINRLALQKAWTSEEKGRGFSVWRAIEKIIAKPLSKTLILGSSPAGHAAAAIPAFMQAMRPNERPKANP